MSAGKSKGNEKKASAGMGRLLLLLIFATPIFAFLWSIRGVAERPDMSEPMQRMIFSVTKAIRISTYVPDALTAVSEVPVLKWGLDYAPFTMISAVMILLVVSYLWSLLMVTPQSSIVEDPAYVIQHLGVDTPALNHLDDIVYVCPVTDWDDLIYDFVLGGISAEAPPSKAITLTDDPTKGVRVEFKAE